MALIGKIRAKSGLLVAMIGIALLAFILNDYQSLFGIGEGEYGIGLVFGDKVDPATYSIASAKFQEQERNQAAQNSKAFTETDMEASSDKAWNFMVDSTILSKEYEKLGIGVTDRELDSYWYAKDGFNVLQDLNQFFTDSLTGIQTPQSIENGRVKLKATLDNLKKSKEAQAVDQWNGFKSYHTDRRKTEKYFGLLKQGVYVTDLEAEDQYYANNEKKTISFTVRRYTEISDADIKVSETELKAFYEAHKGDKKYAVRNPSRDVKMFDVNIRPSKADSSVFTNKMNTLRAGFSASTNDSAFVAKNSETPVYFSDKRSTSVPEGHPKADRYQTYPMSLDTIFKTAALGQLVGPYVSKEKMVLSKVIGFTPASLKARHILISTNSSKDEKVIAAKKKTADSIAKVLNKTNWDAMANKYSEDPGSKDKGGVYEDFLEGDMVKEFGGYCATAPIGKVGVVKTDFGFHIIEVLDRAPGKFPLLASISVTFKPSDETVANMESEVNGILMKLDRKISKEEDAFKKAALFDTIVTRANYAPRVIQIEDKAPKVYGFTTTMARDRVLEMAYAEDATVGTMTLSPIRDKEKYVIAMISAIRPEGEPLFENVRAQMERELVQEKKAKRFMNQMAGKSLQAISKRFNTPIIDGEVTFGNPQISNAGYEPTIIGNLFSGALKKGQRTLPIKGETGVYVIQIKSSTKAPATTNFQAEKDQLMQGLANQVEGQAMGGLRKKAGVVDNRKLSELGVRL
ncbi:MAG: peptidylprolyl isomerase [Crocinitomicaceae bacterium]|jgi:peptidyl-prolyl cis-trans isomerase D|nr:peptidylprolyl isomerase [Crocinitomicaceae bacterium]MDP4740353.1 peptidylprolyl isomerase [Crocinitomicaceae bacterium]MDP4806833.1 peptidylprolyl isomerase [Crocinitomicaceae bacterium]MDP4955363.1 peptidylprolyl isomerase [Crocinitomicaceae bacterium]MDP5066848.1 peptidylprolyl isomerase [Crocinitomicaceae bacterium]